MRYTDVRSWVLILVTVAGCRMRVETASHATTVSLHFTDACAESLVVAKNVGAGEFAPVEVTEGRVQIDIPSMGGGYDERAGHKSNVSDPTTYPIVRVMHDGTVAKELSLQDVDKLPRDERGAAIVAGVCHTSTTPARIEAGEAAFACVGWSVKERAAACVIGHRGTMGTWMALVDTDVRELDVEVKDPIDNADELNAELGAHGYMKFTHDATGMESGKPIVIGNATLLLTSQSTPSDVENTAPQFDTMITATCGGKKQVAFSNNAEGQEYQASIRRIGERVLIELDWSLAREGEYGSGMDAVVINTQTCENATTDLDMPTAH